MTFLRQVVASGRLKVRLNHLLKIDCFEFNTEKHMEYVPRQQTMLPESPVGPLGIPIKTLRCLEVFNNQLNIHVYSYNIDINRMILNFIIASGRCSNIARLNRKKHIFK